MKAIVYTSNTGSTAQYAKMLGHELRVSVYSADEAKKGVPTGAEILYLGWVMASNIKGYADSVKRYKVLAVCAVGMGQTGAQVKEIREKNAIPDSIPLFTLQGNFDVAKLRGAYKLMMSMMVKTAGKALADKADRTPEEDDMLDMMMNGGKRVRFENLKAVIDWARNREQQGGKEG